MILMANYGDVETAVTGWLIAQYTDWYRKGIDKYYSPHDKFHMVPETIWEFSEIAV